MELITKNQKPSSAALLRVAQDMFGMDHGANMAWEDAEQELKDDYIHWAEGPFQQLTSCGFTIIFIEEKKNADGHLSQEVR